MKTIDFDSYDSADQVRASLLAEPTVENVRYLHEAAYAVTKKDPMSEMLFAAKGITDEDHRASLFFFLVALVTQSHIGKADQRNAAWAAVKTIAEVATAGKAN